MGPILTPSSSILGSQPTEISINPLYYDIILSLSRLLRSNSSSYLIVAVLFLSSSRHRCEYEDCFKTKRSENPRCSRRERGDNTENGREADILCRQPSKNSLFILIVSSICRLNQFFCYLEPYQTDVPDVPPDQIKELEKTLVAYNERIKALTTSNKALATGE